MSHRSGILIVAGGLALSLAAPAAGAQGLVARADDLLRAGRVFAAESVYYYAAALEPRDPRTRLALGKYLARRGAWRVGAVLTEEARYFGAEARLVAAEIAPVYVTLNDYRALASLPGTALPYAERARADWLADSAPGIAGPDSAPAAFAVDTADATVLGRLTMIVGADTVAATIEAGLSGLVLDSAWVRRPGIKVFRATTERNPRMYAGVARTIVIGSDTLMNVPARFEALGVGADSSPAWRRARMGLDVAGQLAPTFDPTGTVVLRRSGRIGQRRPGERIPTLADRDGIALIINERLVPIASPEGRALLNGRRWTLNPRRGEVVLDLK